METPVNCGGLNTNPPLPYLYKGGRGRRWDSQLVARRLPLLNQNIKERTNVGPNAGNSVT